MMWLQSGPAVRMANIPSVLPNSWDMGANIKWFEDYSEKIESYQKIVAKHVFPEDFQSEFYKNF